MRAVAGAAGGPKGLVLNPLDRFVFGHWLQGHVAIRCTLLGASIERLATWRALAGPMPTPRCAEMAEDYIAQRYEHKPGRAPRRAT